MYGYGRDYYRNEPNRGRREEMGSGWHFGNWDDRSGFHAQHGRYGGEYDGDFRHGGGGWGMESLANEFWQGGTRYGSDYDRPLHPDQFRGRNFDSGRGGGRPARWTGTESNRHRGVYGSDFRFGQPNPGEHGGYRGSGWNRGGGMNPGRPDHWR